MFFQGTERFLASMGTCTHAVNNYTLNAHSSFMSAVLHTCAHHCASEGWAGDHSAVRAPSCVFIENDVTLALMWMANRKKNIFN